MIEDDTGISIHTHEELVRFKSLRRREYAHTCIYDVSLLERVGLDLDPPHHLPHGLMGETLQGTTLKFASLNSQISYYF
jgi:hypothetical protein